MAYCGKCDMCILRNTGVGPDLDSRVFTDCGVPKNSIMRWNPSDWTMGNGDAPTAREVELRNSQAISGRKDSSGNPVLTPDGQRVIRLGQALLAEEAPIGGYVVLLTLRDMESDRIREDLLDYLKTVALRFGVRPPVIDIKIRGWQ